MRAGDGPPSVLATVGKDNYFPARQTQALLEPTEKLFLRPFAANIKTKFLTTVSNAFHNPTTTKWSRFKSLSFVFQNHFPFLKEAQAFPAFCFCIC